jgi:V/A-type H+-transporting ATPase subunit B
LLGRPRFRGREEEFAVIFAAIGVQNDEARYFKTSLEESWSPE